MKKLLIFSQLCLVSIPVLNQAQTVNGTNLSGTTNTLNPITTAVPFLLISPDSKQGGMGDAGVATDPDINSIHWNGSKLAFMEKKYGVGFTVTPWLRYLVPDINMYYLSGYAKINDKQTVGGSLRYFSLGNIELTDVTGLHYADAKPNEFAVDLAFSQKLSKNFSVGVASRFINSTISRYYTSGASGNAASTVAVDLSMYYKSNKFKLGDKMATATGGLAFTNIGAKIKFSNDQNFIPMNMRLGGGLKTELDKFNKFSVYVDFNKLLVPTPPIYAHYTTAAGKDSIGIDPATGKQQIYKGKDPNVDVVTGILQSFGGAPDGIKEELQEVIVCGGMEYSYNDILFIRSGYFHESKHKGARQYFTMGVGFRFNFITLDGSYLIPTSLQNPLARTWRLTFSFNFDAANDSDSPKDPVQP